MTLYTNHDTWILTDEEKKPLNRGFIIEIYISDIGPEIYDPKTGQLLDRKKALDLIRRLTEHLEEVES